MPKRLDHRDKQRNSIPFIPQFSKEKIKCLKECIFNFKNPPKLLFHLNKLFHFGYIVLTVLMP